MYSKYYRALIMIVFLTINYSSWAADPIYTPGPKTRFNPTYRTHQGRTGSVTCENTTPVCVESNTEKIIEGVKVRRPCWKYNYRKTCQTYPSLNDCKDIKHYYFVADIECLTWDSYGNCVNIKKEFCSKRWEPDEVENKKTRVGLKEKDGVGGIVCGGIPCLDGNCVDKSYSTNGEMMDSISKLYAVSQAKGSGNLNVSLFPGTPKHCTKKAISYSNCCTEGNKKLFNNWGHHIGAHCSPDEKKLLEDRKNKLCVYVGKENKGNMRINVRHHYCCWGNLLHKVIQVEGRKQLGMNFGYGKSPNCRGLTLNELLRIDFNKIDFSEFIEEYKTKYFEKFKAPNVGDVAGRIKSSISDINKSNSNLNDPANNQSGWTNKFKDE